MAQALLMASAARGDEQVVATLPDAKGLTAFGGHVVWSQPDGASRRWRLMQWHAGVVTRLPIPPRAVEVVSGRREAPGVARRGRLTLVSSRPPSNRACGSPAHGSPTSFAAGVRRSPPGPVGSGCDDGSVEADQAVAVGLLEDPAAVVCAALVAFADEQGEAIERVGRDQVEVLGGVSVAEVARPAAQEGVDLPRDVFDGKSSRWRVVICLTQSRACCIARREGQRARKLMGLACDPRTRTQR